MKINARYDQPLPDGREKFTFLTKPEQTLTGAEYKALSRSSAAAFIRQIM